MSDVQDYFVQRTEWDKYKEESLRLIKEKDIYRAFPPQIWNMLTVDSVDFQGKKVLVPSSGDNFAVFAFSLLGAFVTSSDFTSEVIEKAKVRADEHGLTNIEFKNEDTMALVSLPDNEYDFVFTSNGVYNCLNDIQKAHNAFFRVLKPNGIYCFYENHPFYNRLSEKTNLSGSVCKGTGKLKFEAEKYKTYTENDSLCNFFTIEDYTNSLLNAGFSITDYCDIHRPEDAIPVFAHRGIRFIVKEKMPIWLGISVKKPINNK